MKKTLHAAALCGALVLSFGFSIANAQESVPVSAAENGDLWFVELSGAPTADGNTLTKVRNEKAAFRAAAVAMGVNYQERAAYDVLFNGFAVKVSKSERLKLATVSGIKAMWPIDTVAIPEPEDSGGSAIDLATAIQLTGADIAQNTLGITGAGVRVAIMDTGVDYDHADLGGDGTDRSDSNMFPTGRVVAGFDFVGDTFNADPNDPAFNPVPTPDTFPDDCNGHGTHVAGIAGANGDVVGVAPDIVYGAYRVFGCAGSTTTDIMLAAMEAALADNMDVLNMSIGSRTQWPQYPTAAAATRLLKKGMVVVASIGNNGPGGSAPDGPYAAGAPGVGADVIGVASFDNKQVAFRVSPDNRPVGYNPASSSPLPPTSGTFPLAKTGTPTTANDGCLPAQFAGFPAGAVALIRRGTCTFHIKSLNAQNAGATAVVLYNNQPGALNASVLGTPAITIPVVGITADDGALIDARIAAGPTTLTWTSDIVSFPFGSGGIISGFSSYGMAPDLTLKPDIGAPGGSIFSTIPLGLGGHGFNSGTSMSSPHVAGAVALLLEAEPALAPSAVRARLQNSSDPAFWFGNPGLGDLESAHRQGAGMADIDDAITADVDVTPGKLSLGESQAGPQTRRLTIRNRGSAPVTFALSAVEAVATGPKNPLGFQAVSFQIANSTVAFSAPNVAVPPGATRTVDVTIAPNPGLQDQSQYGGYVVLTPQGSGEIYRVPFAGFKGDYQTVKVITPSANFPQNSTVGFPWLAKLIGPSFFNQPGGATYTLVGDDTPFFLVHLNHQSRHYEFRILNAANAQPVHPVFNKFDEDEFVGRNTTATGFFAFVWDGTRAHSNGNHNMRKVVPDGQYIVQLRVLKALGDANNTAHWETWNSPVVTIDRP